MHKYFYKKTGDSKYFSPVRGMVGWNDVSWDIPSESGIVGRYVHFMTDRKTCQDISSLKCTLRYSIIST